MPLPKKPKVEYLNHLRPCILPILSKMIEKIVYQQLYKYVTKHNLLPDRQSGFRRRHSTTTALLQVTDEMLPAINSSYVTVLVLLDFTKAFDLVQHDLLLAKLK